MQRQGNAPPHVPEGPCSSSSCSWWSSSPSWAAFLLWPPLCGKHRVALSSTSTARIHLLVLLAQAIGTVWWEPPCYSQPGDIGTDSLLCLAEKASFSIVIGHPCVCPSLQQWWGDTALGSTLISRGAGGPKYGGPKHMSLWGGKVPCSLVVFLNNPLLFPRCVSDRQRSFALGIQWIVVRTLGMEQSEFGHEYGLLALWNMCQAVT